MMIASAFISTTSGRKICPMDFKNSKATFDLSTTDSNSFDLEIIFDSPIIDFRNHDFTWVKPDKPRIAGLYSPRAIKLSDGNFVQPNIQTGIWEISDNNPKHLMWRFNPTDSAPLTNYSGVKNDKVVEAANFPAPKSVQLLFSKHNAIEFSRSPSPFSAVACFTDHCDFDTLQSLKIQREFFKSCGIKTTKGFFLNHFSKRTDNASFENDADEIVKWQADGHELAYHSLSQSIKSDSESFADFRDFNPPFAIPTWIDHGYQPYNLSLYRNSGMSDYEYGETLKSKKIETLWNYIDSGTATRGAINQMNADDFTLANFGKGNKNLGFKRKFSLLVKNILFHHYADEKIITDYKLTAGNLKNVIYQKKFKNIFPMLRHVARLSGPMLRVMLFWNSHKNTPNRFAKFSPTVFHHTISGQTFNVFQTIEMINFKNALHPENLEKLIGESGLFIAHTYFSAPMPYHTGRMFSDPETIDAEVAANFRHLGKKIKSGEIWNPTLDELVKFLATFEKTVLDIDADGRIFVDINPDVPHRTIS